MGLFLLLPGGALVFEPQFRMRNILIAFDFDTMQFKLITNVDSSTLHCSDNHFEHLRLCLQSSVIFLKCECVEE